MAFRKGRFIGSKNKSFGLIEVLVATVILATGLLAIAILQQKSLAMINDSENYATAVSLANEMANRLQANKAESKRNPNIYLYSRTSVNSSYDDFTTETGDNSDHETKLSAILTTDKCYTTTACTSQQLAAADLLEWKEMVKNSLPDGKGIICFDAPGPFSCDNYAIIQCGGLGNSCSQAAPGSSSSSSIYTIKVTWTDTKNTTREYKTQTIISASNTLALHQSLTEGQQLVSANGMFYLSYEANNNIVLKSKSGFNLWETGAQSGTNGSLTMQCDGHLVLYTVIGSPPDTSTVPQWFTGVSGIQYCGSFLELQNNGRLVIYKPDNTEFWARGIATAGVLAASTKDVIQYPSLPANYTLYPGQSIVSRNNERMLFLDNDGNLRFYDINSGFALKTFYENTQNKTIYWLGMQGDGNLVLRDEYSNQLWYSGTNGGSNAYLDITDDNRLVIFSSNGSEAIVLYP